MLLPDDQWCIEVKTGSFPNSGSTCGIVNIAERQLEYNNRIGDKTISTKNLKLCILNQKDNYSAERCMDGYCLNSPHNKTCEKLNSTSIPILKNTYNIIGVTGSNNYCLTNHGSVSKQENCFSYFDDVCLDVTKYSLSCWDLSSVSTPDNTVV